MSDSGTSRFEKIDKNTGVAIGLVVILVAAVLGFHRYIDGRFDELLELTRDHGHLLEKLEERTDKAWTRTEQQVWALKLQQRNPALKVPGTGE